MKVIAKVPVSMLFLFFALSQSTETVFTTGLPQISDYFGVKSNLAQKASSSYFLGFAIGILILGRISDLIGRRSTVFFGLSLYIASSMICLIVDNIYLLILMRFFQAFGASVGSVVAQAMARDSYKGSSLTAVYSTLGVALSLTPSVGSIIGSNIVAYFGWRYNFVFMNLYCITLFILCIRYLPETYPYIGVPSGNFRQVLRSLLLDKKVLSFAFMIGAFNGIFYSFYIEAPFIYIEKIGIKHQYYGYFVLLPLCIAASLGSYYTRYLVRKMTDENIIILESLVISFISTCAYTIFTLSWYYKILDDNIVKYLLLIPMLVQGFSHSMLMPTILRRALHDYDKVNGTAGSIFGFIYYMLIAAVNYATTQIHSDNFSRVGFMYIILVAISIMLYKIIIKEDDPTLLRPYR